jgi:Flp pilus assembly protein TadB
MAQSAAASTIRPAAQRTQTSQNSQPQLNAPQANTPRQQRHPAASKQVAPLDAAFLRRCFGTTLWLGALLALCVASVFRSAAPGLSCAAGVLLGALLLKSQEWFVRRALRPRDATPVDGEPVAGRGRKLSPWLLLPFKYALLAGVIAGLFSLPGFRPLFFVLGCGMVQTVVVARAMGRLLAAVRQPLRAVYVQRDAPL